MKCKCNPLDRISGNNFVCNNCGKKWVFKPWLSNPWEDAKGDKDDN